MNALKEYDATYMRCVCVCVCVCVGVGGGSCGKRQIYCSVWFLAGGGLAELVVGPQDVVKWRGMGFDLLGT